MEVKIQIPDNCELIKDEGTYIVKEKDNKPRSWEEFCDKYPILPSEYYFNGRSIIFEVVMDAAPRDKILDRNVCTSKEEAEAFLALIQLRQLRKAWVGDWDYQISSQNYIPSIVCVKESGIIITESIHNNVLSFPTKEMVEDFLNCFKELCGEPKISDGCESWNIKVHLIYFKELKNRTLAYIDSKIEALEKEFAEL